MGLPKQEDAVVSDDDFSDIDINIEFLHPSASDLDLNGMTSWGMAEAMASAGEHVVWLLRHLSYRFLDPSELEELGMPLSAIAAYLWVDISNDAGVIVRVLGVRVFFA